MNTTEDIVVEVSELTKMFRDFWRRPKVVAVDKLSLKIPRGEVFGLLGPNGSGKSTTIKILLGLLKPTSGEVKVLGKAPDDVSAKKSIGYLPEESHLYNYLTPKETLDFYGRLFDMSSKQIKERTDQLLEMTGLAHAANRPVGEFSKGMARRIGLSQALINDPELVVLDEPTSGLDPVGCRQVKDLIGALAKRGKTVILSSHLLADVEDVCDHVSILYNGKIQAAGRITELLEERDRISLTV
ncbi:ABC transporter ATP-binding protein, partial [bacterium B17]